MSQPEDDTEIYTIMYDCTLRKPGCVLLQCFADLPKELFYRYFGDSNCWLVAPTPDMKLYRVTKSMLPILAEKTDFTR